MELNAIDPKLQQLILMKESGYNYRERREEQWRENYTLYRDTVIVNRLTQRQSVNVPLMKTNIRSMLKDVDDMPVIVFENIDNDEEAEMFFNEYWKDTLDKNKAEIKDIVDKKQDFLFGRTFDQWQIVDGKVKWSIVDPEDILVDRYCDPTDIDTSRFLIHTHIFRTISQLKKNPDYDQQAIAELEKWYGTTMGLIKQQDNQNSLTQKNQKMADLGLSDVENPILGETVAELSMYFVYDYRPGSTEEELFIKVEADNYRILMSKPLEDVIGKTSDNYWKNHFPYNSWADDVEIQDFWSDGVADILRTPNKILNTWLSQLVEHRTLRSFRMRYFNNNIEGWAPQTWQPIPFGSYGVPVPEGKRIQDVIQDVDIPDLSESIDEMQYVTQIAEKATGATATQQGAVEQRQITLGEIQLALGEAKERIKGISKYYTHVWKQRALKFSKLVEAGQDKLDAVKIFKKGRNSKRIFDREISPKDYLTKSGYLVQVYSQDEKNMETERKLNKLSAIKQNFPDNPVVQKVFERKLFEFGEFTPDEVKEAMDFEEQKRKALMTPDPMAMGVDPMQQNTMSPNSMLPPQSLPVPQPGMMN